MFPIPDTVFDYYLDESYNFSSWKSQVLSITPTKDLQVLIPTAKTIAYTFLLSKLNSVNESLMLIGGSGVGKSSIASIFISEILKTEEVQLVQTGFSARTTSLQVQTFIENKLERKSLGVYSGLSHKKLFIFIDDVNLPLKDQFSSQPPIELLRQLQDNKGFYDRKKPAFKNIMNFNVLCNAGVFGIKDLDSRFIRHFFTFFVSEPSHEILFEIYSTILGSHLDKAFSETIRKMIPSIIAASIELFDKILIKLKPTPAKFHYKYTHRDIRKLIQGVTFASPSVVSNAEKLTKL